MKLIKKLAITIMYIYIFMLFYNAVSLIPVIMLCCLIFINYNLLKSNFDKKLKESLSNQKENFIGLLNHDIRIPVIAQIRALELLKAERFGNISPSTKEMIVQTEQSCRYVLNLLSLMIDTYGLENNTYKLFYEKFNISDTILSCFNEISLQSNEKRIQFEYECKSKNISITADKIELKKVIFNILSSLVSNAAYGEIIQISLTESNNRIKITILGGENKTSINSKYNSVGENVKMRFCKKIIESHNGKIFSDRKALCFELPVVPA